MTTQLQILAVGTHSHDTTELRAVSRYTPSAEEVEHRIVRWVSAAELAGDTTEERWIAEVRVNQAMRHRSIFRGPHAYENAVAWCQLIAPHVRGTIDLPMDDDAWRALLANEIDALPVDDAEYLTPDFYGGYEFDLVDHDAENDDYRDYLDDIADREFAMRGAW